MRVTADTNVLVRALVDDEPEQARLAREALAASELVAIPLPALCEVVWVLRRGYRIPPAGIVAFLRRLIGARNVAVDHGAVALGIAMLESGGDFADGAVAWAGTQLGGETFLSFDRTAVALLAAQGHGGRVPQ